VPEPGPLTADDTALLGAAEAVLADVRREFGDQAFNRGLETIWKIVGDANRYVDAQAPWTLRKTDPPRMATVLYVLAETIRRLALLVQPVMPDSAAKMLDQLAVPADERDFARLGEGGRLVPGTPLPKPEGVFPRFVEETDAATAGS
jgi:methionyl-tRNA synthetase